MTLTFEIEFVGDWPGATTAGAARMTDRPPIVVLLGGPSAEHDVSIVSGTAIADALADAGHDVEQVLIDLDGAWWWLPAGHRRDGRPQCRLRRAGRARGEWPACGRCRHRPSRRGRPAPVVFIALHGPFGEDGTVQALLEAAGVAYTGSGVAASAIGMDKTLFKRMCRGIGLPVVDWREIRAERWATDPAAVRAELDAFAAAAADPRLMVKPARLGSSVGMTLVHDPPSSRARSTTRSATTPSRSPSATCRAPATSRSRSSAMRAQLELYGPGEIVSGHEFYDYAAKYTPGLSETSTRAEVTDAQRATIIKIARDAFRAIGAEGFARVDFLVVGERIYLSEINTIPGFTPISLFPTMPAEGGYSFADVCEPDRGARHRATRRPGRRRLTPADLPR